LTILTVTLNPAIDLATATARLTPNTKLRSSDPTYAAGGGGINVSRAIAKLGGQSTLFAAIGGATGQMFRTMLEGEGHSAIWFEAPGTTRQNVTVLEKASNDQYRFVFPGPVWDEVQCERALAALGEASRNASYVVGSGSLPPGIPDDFYDRLGERAEAAGAHFVLDTSGGALREARQGIGHLPYLWIMDNAEASEIAGRPLPSMEALEDFASELGRKELAKVVIVTYADGGAVAVADGKVVFKGRPPKVEVVSKVGAGDSFVAGLVFRLAEGWSVADATAYAMAAAASAVTRPAGQLSDREQTERYYEMIQNVRNISKQETPNV
jgi:6-phosphofructokinase 2